VTDPFARIADWILSSRRTVVFTGAGMSTESGIPDFRSPGGVWDRFDPSEFTFQNFIGSESGRRRYWELGRAVYPAIRRAEPNAGHEALVTLWRLGRLDCVITQNIDNLHQRAGLPDDRVIELHGNAPAPDACAASGRTTARRSRTGSTPAWRSRAAPRRAAASSSRAP